jgi:anti-anti-sigma factor
LNGGIVTEPRLDETIITLWGEIDDSLRTTASSAIAMALESKKPIALDLSDVDFMDSTGAAFLVQIKHYALDDGIKVTLRGASDAAMTVMEMLGTLDMFDSGASTSFTHLRTQPRHGPGGRPPEGLR